MRRCYLSSALLLPAIGLIAFAFPAQNLFAQTPTGRYDPVAGPAAMVQQGHARFTVLTPAMIRMEWSANGHFEDRASLVFLNRRLLVPAFTHVVHAVEAAPSCISTQTRSTSSIAPTPLRMDALPLPVSPSCCTCMMW